MNTTRCKKLRVGLHENLSANVVLPNLSVYNASKAGLNQFARTVALEVASKGVRVNSINPGIINTEVNFVKPSDRNMHKVR